jgi:TetR/AcrR family transcriptional regulator, transcriptional repressor for nem operon
MPNTKAANRTRLLDAAMKVTYRRGFAQAALSDIAKQADVPLGNVYYYFKTKNQIAEAIVEKRLSRLRLLLHELDSAPSPQERLCGFVQLKIENREELARTGCPVGTLLSELHKLGNPVAGKSTTLFAEALAWMEAQFQALGKGPASGGLAVHLLSATQGVSLLAHAFRDPALITAEAERLQAWIRSL